MSKLTVFAGAAAALFLASAIGVAAGGVVSKYLGPRLLHTFAGIGFITIGIWTLTRS